jgi:Fuc2NAc and GlcNAc transferase
MSDVAVAATAIAISGVGAFALTALVRRALLHFGILDLPNERSSHQRPIVRGAGIAIAVAWIAGSLVVLATHSWPAAGVSLVVMATMLAALGLCDDAWHLSPVLRLAAQVVICGAASVMSLGIERLTLPLGIHLELGAWGLVASSIWLVAMVNIFNFMDGIDGLAAGQTLVAGAVLGAAALIVGASTLTLLAGCLAAAALGFLPFNWSPARCFMGDAGSYFCGGAYGGLLLLGEGDHLVLGVAVIAAAPFLLDGIVTFVRRLLRLEPVWLPHRSHYYQRLASSRGHRLIASWYVLGGLILGAAWLAGLQWHVVFE